MLRRDGTAAGSFLWKCPSHGGKDRDGNPVKILIGPDATTMITTPDTNNPSIAERPGGQDDIVQE